MERFTFPVILTPDPDGGFVVTFPDVPEAITQGNEVAQCLAEAADCLDEAISARISDGLALPEPAEPAQGQPTVALPLQTALKAALYVAMQEERASKSELARRLHVDEKEARRILDPRYGTKLPTLERALHALGKRVEVRVSQEAGGENDEEAFHETGPRAELRR